MPSPCVLLDDGVLPISEKASDAGVFGREGYELIGCWDGSLMAEDEAPVGGTSARAAEALSTLFSGKQPASGDTHRIAQAIKLFARLAEAPEVSSLAVVVSAPEKDLYFCFVENADRNLLLLSIGFGSFGSRPSHEYYLIFNASRNSLTIIPKPPIIVPFFYEADQTSIGNCEAVILLVEDEGEGGWNYILAELTVTSRDRANGTIWLWKSKDETRWIPNKVAVPVGFYARSVFSLSSSSYVCWVDLFMGVLICDVTRDYPELHLIPLPEECLVDLSDDQQSCPSRFRTMAAVGGIIKFASMNGYLKGDVTVTIWTLNLESGAWSKVREFGIQTLWKNKIIRANGLEGCTPMCLVLRGYEDDTVYFLVKKEPALKFFTYYTSGKVDDEKHYMIGVNMINSEVHVFESSQRMVADCVVSYLTSCFPEYLSRPNKGGEAGRRPTKLRKISATYPAGASGMQA